MIQRLQMCFTGTYICSNSANYLNRHAFCVFSVYCMLHKFYSTYFRVILNFTLHNLSTEFSYSFFRLLSSSTLYQHHRFYVFSVHLKFNFAFFFLTLYLYNFNPHILSTCWISFRVLAEGAELNRIIKMKFCSSAVFSMLQNLKCEETIEPKTYQE